MNIRINSVLYISVLLTLLLPLVTSQATYVECVPGDLNVIVSAPHGGYEEPDTIRDRTAGCFVDGECVWDHDCGTPDEDECARYPTEASCTVDEMWIFSDAARRQFAIRSLKS